MEIASKHHKKVVEPVLTVKILYNIEILIASKKVDSDKKACFMLSTTNNSLLLHSQVNCVWGSWSSWSTCGVTCGGSVQLRSRLITTPSQESGTCSGNPTESQDCATTLCPGGNKSLLYFSIEHMIIS